jgi:hypothetical protein
MAEQESHLRMIALCWDCAKEYDITDWKKEVMNVKCECGGYIVSPSGKVQLRLIK